MGESECRPGTRGHVMQPLCLCQRIGNRLVANHTDTPGQERLGGLEMHVVRRDDWNSFDPIWTFAFVASHIFKRSIAGILQHVISIVPVLLCGYLAFLSTRLTNNMLMKTNQNWDLDLAATCKLVNWRIQGLKLVWESAMARRKCRTIWTPISVICDPANG